LSDRKGRGAGEHGDHVRADHARPAVVGGERGGDACEERERVDSEREQQPAEEAKAKDAQGMPMMIMVDISVTKGLTGAPSTTTTAHCRILPKTIGGSGNPVGSRRRLA
jgi:hypothetical protein